MWVVHLFRAALNGDNDAWLGLTLLMFVLSLVGGWMFG